MKARTIKSTVAGVGAALVLCGTGAQMAQAETLQRKLVCNGAEPNALTANVGLVSGGCANGEYDPETETYAPYDPATDDNGLLGLNKTLGVDFLGL